MNSWHGILLREIQYFWQNIRIFCYINRTILELFFIFAYTIEQFFLIQLTYNLKDIEQLNYIIAIFALIVLTTFAIHKLLMESRIKYLEQQVKELQEEKFIFGEKVKFISQKYQELFEKKEKQYLNTNISYNNKKKVNK